MSEEMPTLECRYAVFNTFTRISDAWEGDYLEQIAPTAFAKTTSENRESIRAQFAHGRDPQIGGKVLGHIEQFRSDSKAAYADISLHPTSYVSDLLPGLRTGQYGSSFRFEPVRSDREDYPARSEHNPHGIPEVTRTECRLLEVGPCPFGAYPDAGNTVRSSDEPVARAEGRRFPNRRSYLRWLDSKLAA